MSKALTSINPDTSDTRAMGRLGGLSRSPKKVKAAIENLKIARRFTPIAKPRPLKVTRSRLEKLQRKLTDMEYKVVSLRIGPEASSVIEVGNSLKLSRQRVYQIQNSALTKLNGRS